MAHHTRQGGPSGAGAGCFRRCPEDTVSEFDIPGSRLDLDDIGQGHHQGGIGPAFAKGIDGDGFFAFRRFLGKAGQAPVAGIGFVE